jgi:predicted PilT family ATPase
VAPTSFSSSKSSPTKMLALSSSNNYVRRIHVPKKYHSLIVGKNGNNLARLKHDFNAQITIPAKSSSNENVISNNLFERELILFRLQFMVIIVLIWKVARKIYWQ